MNLPDFADVRAAADRLRGRIRHTPMLRHRALDEAAGGTVLPFVGDDLLQSFDDARAAAAFRALLRLSDTAQVILLSHHEHLLRVLRETLPASAIHLQRLEHAAA